MRFLFAALVFLTAMSSSNAALAAQPTSSIENRLSSLEYRVAEQDRTIDDLYERLDRMDRRGSRPGRRPGSPAQVVFNCLVIDSGMSKTFAGTGASQLDAEFAAKSVCEKTVHPSYCTQKARCDSSMDLRGATGATCLATDTGMSKTFRGEGSTPIAAEAAAKTSCQTTVHPSYCGAAALRCELKY